MATSIIDTFITVFGVDLDPMKKGTADAQKQLGGLEKELSSAEVVSGKLGSSFQNMIIEGGKALGALLAVHHAISETIEAARTAHDVGMLSDKLGMGADQITAWGQAAVHAGGTAKGMQASMEALRSSAEQMALTGENAMSPVMRLIGVDFLNANRQAKPLSGIMLELADRFSQMKDKGRAFELGKQLGLDQGTVTLLMMGRHAVEDMIKKQQQLGTITKEDTEAAKKFNAALDDFGYMGRMIWTAVMTDIQPALTWFVEGLKSIFGYLREHKDFVTGFFIALAGVILTMVVPALWAMAAALWANPITWVVAGIIALVAAFALLYDDIQAFRQGHDSVIGSMIAGWKKFFDFFMNGKGPIAEALRIMFAPLWLAVEAIEKLIQWGGKLGSWMAAGEAQIKAANASPLNAQTAGSVIGGNTNTSNKSVQIDNISIQSGADPKAIHKEISNSLQDHLTSTITGADDGVLA